MPVSLGFRRCNHLCFICTFYMNSPKYSSCNFCKVIDGELLLFTTHLVKSENTARVDHKESMGKGLRRWSNFFGRKFWPSMDEKIGKPAFKSPPEPENVGGIIAAEQCSANYWLHVSAVAAVGVGGRGGGDKGLLATKPVPSLASTQPTPHPLALLCPAQSKEMYCSGVL